MDLRVSAPAGLNQLVPGPSLDGSAAAAVDLLYEYAPSLVRLERREGRALMFRRLPGVQRSTAELARALRYEGLVSARALGPDRLEADFKDARAARRAAKYGFFGFAFGPYKIESFQPGHAVLRRRTPGAIDVIDIRVTSKSNEWRQLMARKLDLIPTAARTYRDQFQGMRSVRVLDMTPMAQAALFFNRHDAALSDARVRRRLAGLLNRKAIARVACGAADCASAVSAAAEEPDVALPSRLRLLVYGGETTLRLAAEVVRHQMAEAGVDVEIDAVDSLKDEMARYSSQEYQLAMVTMPKGERRYQRFTSANSVMGLASPEYDQAVARKDFDAAQKILDRDMPATPLFDIREFAAIDERFCGDVKPTPGSWRWMADLHPCQDDGAPP